MAFYRLNIKYDLLNEDSIRRYPIYLKAARKLQSEGFEFTESKDLARFTGIDSVTIRKDLFKLGKLGIKSKGYKINTLVKALSEVLGTDSDEKIILVGVGEIGSALLNYNSWKHTTGSIICAFDEKPAKCKSSSGIPVYSMNDLEKKIPEDCHIAILCTSKNTQKIVNRLTSCGIEGIINYTLQHFDTPADVVVDNVDLLSHVQSTAMQVKVKNIQKEEKKEF